MRGSSSSSIHIEKNWEPLIGPHIIRVERVRLTQFLRAYMNCFAFDMKELGALIRLGIHIELTSDTPIFLLFLSI